MKVLVIIADGFHLGYLGCYGNEWVAAPALDCLAAEGIVFDQHYSDRPDTRGAHQSWRTGNYLFPDITAATRSSTSSTPSPDLLQLLQAAGIATSLVIDGKKSKEFALGWDNVHEIPTPNQEETPLEQALETALAAVDELADRRDWLLWLELSALLPPWNVPEQFLQPYFEKDTEEEDPDSQSLNPFTDPLIGFVDENDDATLMRLQRTYAGAVSFLDSALGDFFAELRRRNLFDEMMIVLTTGQGFPLGEHRMVGNYQPLLHEELVHVPLIIRLPGAAEAGRRIGALTQPVDLMPTLLDAFGLPIPRVHGFSVFPLIRGEEDSIRGYACSALKIGDACEWALRSADWAFLLPLPTAAGEPPPNPRLYVKPDDRWEVNDVIHQHWEQADNLGRVLRKFVEATRQPGPLQLTELNAQGPQLTSLNQANSQREGTES